MSKKRMTGVRVMTDYKIRDFAPADFPQVRALWEEVGMNSPRRADTLGAVERTLRHEGAKFFILAAVESGEIVGTSWLTCDGRRLLLHHFAVKPSHQGRGLSGALLDATLKQAKTSGLQVKLEVHRGNTRAIEIYKTAGFQSLGDYEIFILRDLSKIP